MTARSAGEREHFANLYRSTRSEILAYVLRRVGEREDAADVLAQVYETAWRRLEDVPSGDDTRLWLYGVARRTLANHHRRDRAGRNLGESLRNELRVSNIGRTGPDRTDATTAAVHEALAALDPVARELLTLTAWEGFTPGEIAAMTGASAGAVRVRLHRARAQLRVKLARLGIAVEDDPVGLLAGRPP